ncbi:flagellar basal body-associated protein FliL [Halomonas sp. YLGW01]|uniref:flagellar basal body-associated protein FliL n=1 Tax=Halomonas sp. YLGW01 TaxID=2773308 RepID=UPI001780B4EA|nr:flagellar basal body-associated protein FliL [Halomonas sp. YLGW01]
MADSSKGSRKSWLIIGLLLVLTSSVTALAVYFLMGNASSADASEDAAAPVETPAPIFVKIDPFTVNIADGQYGDRLLYVGLSLRVKDQQTQDLLVDHMPQVRSRLLMLLSGQHADELTSPEGKTRLAAAILGLFEVPLTEPQPDLAISDVLFTEFIVQ